MPRVLKPFKYFEPQTIEEACQILSQYGSEAKVLAGGTDVVVFMKKREISPKYIVYIKNIPGLDSIHYTEQDGLRIGPFVTHQSITDSSIIQGKFRLLATACNKVGTPQIRNMGTIGGNVCMAGPSQDAIPPLLALEARLKLVSVDNTRTVPIDTFFLAPFQSILRPDEILTGIEIPALPTNSAGCYRWVTKISTVDETLAGAAVIISRDISDGTCKDIKIALTSVAHTPMRAIKAEELIRNTKVSDDLVDRAAQVAADATSPRSRADYRRRMTGVLVREAINEAWMKLKG